MITALRRAYDWLSGVRPLPKDETFAFRVMLGDLEVGVLRAEDGEWIFMYSEEFRSQDRIKPIVDFPHKDREYRNKTLWPFFALRIPSTEQAEVREFLEHHSSEDVDEGILLREFGGRSIANPFRLVPA